MHSKQNSCCRDTVDNKRMTECLKREAETLIRMSGVTEIQTVYCGGGKFVRMFKHKVQLHSSIWLLSYSYKHI